MFAERIITETDQSGRIKNMPLLPPNKRFEIILLDLNETTPGNGKKRVPHSEIKGKMQIFGDIINTAPQDLWDLPV